MKVSERMIYAVSISILINAALAVKIFLLRKQLKEVETRPESVELKEFLFDLLSGSSLVQVKRIASSDVVLRSPRGNR